MCDVGVIHEVGSWVMCALCGDAGDGDVGIYRVSREGNVLEELR